MYIHRIELNKFTAAERLPSNQLDLAAFFVVLVGSCEINETAFPTIVGAHCARFLLR